MPPAIAAAPRPAMAAAAPPLAGRCPPSCQPRWSCQSAWAAGAANRPAAIGPTISSFDQLRMCLLRSIRPERLIRVPVALRTAYRSGSPSKAIGWQQQAATKPCRPTSTLGSPGTTVSAPIRALVLRQARNPDTDRCAVSGKGGTHGSATARPGRMRTGTSRKRAKDCCRQEAQEPEPVCTGQSALADHLTQLLQQHEVHLNSCPRQHSDVGKV